MSAIINTFRSGKNKTVFYPEYFSRSCVKENGDFKIFHVSVNHYIYTFKGWAFNELAGLNLEHFNNIVEGRRLKPENQMYWLQFRANQTLNKIKQLQK